MSPHHCEAHHVEWWHPPGNGTTDIDNLALLCSHCHPLVHDEGWIVVADADGFRLVPP